MNDTELDWFVRSRGRVLGPFKLPQLENLKRAGRLAKFDEVSRDRKNWTRASSLPELYPSVAADAAPLPEGSGNYAATLIEAPDYDLSPSTSGSPFTASSDSGTATWFYMTDNGQTGPVPLTELLRLGSIGTLRGDTYVWNADLVDWVQARTLPQLGLTSSIVGGTDAGATMGGGAQTNLLALLGFIFAVAGLVLFVVAILCTAAFSNSKNKDDEGLLAVAAVGFGGLGAIGSLAAVILSPIGLARAGTTAGQRQGFGLGLTGLILGGLELLGVLLLMLLMIFNK